MSSSKSSKNTIFHKIKSRDGKDLNLFTNLYYHLTVKSIPNGIMAFEPEPREEGHLIQLALNNLEDFDTETEELPAGPLADQALWTILPEVRSAENDCQLRVLSSPLGKLTYTHGGSWGGRYMELDLQNEENYSPQGNMYSSCLWYFQPCEFPEYFTIHNSDPRRDPNFVTFSNEASERGQLMQLGTKDLENYLPKGIFRQDALWQFKPKQFQLFANITNFIFEEPTEADLSDEAYPISVMDEVLCKPENKIDFSTKLPETFKLNFMQSFKPFLEKNVTVDMKQFCGRDKLKFLKGKGDLVFEKKWGSNTQFICLLDTEYKIQQEFQFPKEAEKMKVKGYCSVIKEFEIPFKAVVQVTAKADVSDSSNGLRLEKMEIIDPQVIEYFLKYERFTGKIIKDQKKSNQTDTKVVNCEVSGRLKCSCGLDTYIDVKPVQEK